MLASGWFWLAVLGVIFAWAVFDYNKLVALRVRGNNAWADIDVQLKRRHDLVPNLVSTVEGYASHEKAIFEDVARLRAQAMGSSGPADSDQSEAQLSTAIKSVFAVAENYPELRADQSFRKLQDELTEIENNIQYSRRYYNAVVRDMNTAIETIPVNLIAALGNFKKFSYFQVDESEREAPTVGLTEKSTP